MKELFTPWPSCISCNFADKHRLAFVVYRSHRLLNPAVTSNWGRSFRSGIPPRLWRPAPAIKKSSTRWATWRRSWPPTRPAWRNSITWSPRCAKTRLKIATKTRPPWCSDRQPSLRGPDVDDNDRDVRRKFQKINCRIILCLFLDIFFFSPVYLTPQLGRGIVAKLLECCCCCCRCSTLELKLSFQFVDFVFFIFPRWVRCKLNPPLVSPPHSLSFFLFYLFSFYFLVTFPFFWVLCANAFFFFSYVDLSMLHGMLLAAIFATVGRCCVKKLLIFKDWFFSMYFTARRL